MTDYEFKQDIIVKLRANIIATPIVAGNTTISALHRKNDTKHIDTNYYEISFLNIYYEERKESKIRVNIDCYSQNEIKVERLRSEIIKRLNAIILIDNMRIVSVSPDQTILKLDTDRYVGRVKGDAFFYPLCSS